MHTADCMLGGVLGVWRVTRFTGGEGPHRLGADLPDRPSPLQLLRVSSGWCLARGRHDALRQKQEFRKHFENLARLAQKVPGD